MSPRLSRKPRSLLLAPDVFLPFPPHVQRRHPDGKEERWLRDGRHVIHFNNGTKRTVHADGRIVVAFANGDVKQTYVDGLVIYFYAEAATTHTTRPDGVELFDFPNGQQEKHYPNGLKVITFADETVKHIQKDVRRPLLLSCSLALLLSCSLLHLPRSPHSFIARSPPPTLRAHTLMNFVLVLSLPCNSNQN